jgi:multidrug resistance efflux pump
MRLLSRTLGALMVAVVAALVFAPWQQTSIGAGRVVAFEPYNRMQTIAAPVGGRVKQVWVLEGSEVGAGDRLLEIVDNDPDIVERLAQQREAQVAQLEAARAKAGSYAAQVEALGEARRLAVSAAQSQLEVARAKVQAVRHALEGARAAEEQASLNHARQRALFAEGLASELEYEVAARKFREKQAALAQEAQDLEAAEGEERARIAELGRADTEARARIDTARASKQEADVDVADKAERLAALDTRIAQQATQLVTAPRDGTVFRLLASPGAELVKAGDPLAVLVPDTERRAAELWVDGNDVPLVSSGRRVRLQFEGWPAVQFSGWPSVAVGTFGGLVDLVDRSDDGSGRFRILVVPDPDDEPWPDAEHLRQGARANGFVLLDQVRLGYELWRLANGFPPTAAMTPDAAAPGGKAK